MKIKDIERMANIAWSPATHPSILLATGTAAQQLDASFSTNACLEIYSLNISDPSPEMDIKGTMNTEHRFHKIVWGSQGSDPNGTIVGGCDNGIIQIYNVSKLLAGEKCLISTQNKHTGAVQALDFNTFQGNLMATGAGESEIYIWDMNNTNMPMTPGPKSEPHENVVSIQWNRQVQHILASTFASKCVVWDLRKNEPIIKLSDTVSRIRWKVVAWHPEVATQLCLASEDDQAPIIQLWDLRFATQALKTLEKHQRGILSMAWCSRDPDLLISSGKDNRILCWNPNSDQPGGEVLSEIARTNQWNFEITWCPKNPALIASPGFDGHVSVYSLMGGKTQQIQTTNKIADSFPGMDGYVQAPALQQTSVLTSTDLSKAPKWLKKPAGASFGFGGKLVTFTSEKSKQQNIQTGQTAPSIIYTAYFSQIVTETELINRSTQLEQALEYGNFKDFCRSKADSTTHQHRKNIWHFIKANFEENNRSELLNLLGYDLDDLQSKLNQQLNLGQNDLGLKDGQQNHLNYDFDEFDQVAQSYESRKQKLFDITTDDSSAGLITQAILLGNTEIAVELCMKAKKYAEAIIIARTGGDDLFRKTQYRYLKENDNSLSSLISGLVGQNWSNVVDSCNIKNWKEALVAILTHCNDFEYPNLCERLGDRLKAESDSNPKWIEDSQLCYICAGSLDQLVYSWNPQAQKSSKDLQEIVERIMLLHKAIERQGRTINVTGGFADLLSRYAFILASQGNLQTALNYLGNSKDEQIVELRNRLRANLNFKPTPTQPASSYQSQTSYNQYNQNPVVAPVINQSWQTPPSPMTVPPMQPPRPTSVGSTQGSAGVTSRSKYVLDPSVQPTAMLPPQMMGNALMGGANPQLFQTNAISSSYNNNSYYSPHPSAPLTQPPLNPSNSMPINQTTAFNSAKPPNARPSSTFSPNLLSNAPIPSIPSSMPGVSIPPNMSAMPINASVPSSYSQTQQGQAYGAIEYAKPAYQRMSAPGWNDPPPFTKSSKPQKPELITQDPITHPIYGSTPVSNTTSNNVIYSNQNVMNQAPTYGQIPQNNYQTSFQPPLGPPVDTYNPTNFNVQPINTNAMNANVPYQQNEMGRVERPPPIQKPPIPEEHIHMQTVFDELRNKCSEAAQNNNPQMKRKLEDVSRKLETLYDLLREHKLSPSTLTALHQMVQMIQNGNYADCINLQNQLASGSDFAQIASFMIGIKVMLQCALQLQVFLR